MATIRRNWDRNETLIAFNLYCRTPFGRLHARNAEIVQVAARLGRTPDALAMKCCNLAAFDSTLQARGVSGLRKASRQDAEVWQQFESDPENLAFEAESAHAALLAQDLRTSDSVEWEDVVGLDRYLVTKVRVNQHFFRSMVLSGYRARCAVCGLPIPSLLVASHIVPWSVDRSLRMNPCNGICLCALHDKAFDTGLLCIGSDYRIAVDPSVTSLTDAPAVESNFTRFDGQQVNLPDRWHPDPSLLARHSQIVLRGA